MLEYFIDQEEDSEGGDLNFCVYDTNEEKLIERLSNLLHEADKHTDGVPDKKFHRLNVRGLLGIYLSDGKVNDQTEVKILAKKVMKQGGNVSRFFYWNGRTYRWIQQRVRGSKGKLVPR